MRSGDFRLWVAWLALEYFEQRICGTVNLEMARETFPGLFLHRGSSIRCGPRPALDQLCGPDQIIILRISRPGGDNFSPDVDLVRNENRSSSRERLHNGDSKILLVRGQDERIRSTECAPFQAARQHSGERDGGAGRGQPFEIRLVGWVGAWTGHDKLERLIGSRGIAARCERLDQLCAAFLFVQTTQEKQEPAPPELRELAEELLARTRQIHLRPGSSVIYDHFPASVGRERFARQTPFLFRGEKDSRGSAQHAILAPGPVEQFLQMFERIGSLEPGVEHAVRKNEVRRASSAQSAPDAETTVLPESLNNDRVKLSVPLPDPASEAWCVPVIAATWTQRMNRDRAVADPRVRRRIQRNDLHLMAAAGEQNGRLFHGLNRAPQGRINCVNGSKYFHPECETGSIASRSGPGQQCSTGASNADGRVETRRSFRQPTPAGGAGAKLFRADLPLRRKRVVPASKPSSAEQNLP